VSLQLTWSDITAVCVLNISEPSIKIYSTRAPMLLINASKYFISLLSTNTNMMAGALGSIILILLAKLGLRVYSTSNSNYYQKQNNNISGEYSAAGG
jgi:hypothetical protein